MPQIPVENNDRVSLRITSENKSLLIKAAVLEHTNLTEFIVRTVVAAANEVIEKQQHIMLSEKDTLRVLNLLESPPKPNKKLLEAAFNLPRDSHK
ncbi:MAG: DUF1778 domain-containing protein [Gammaproteobacteria bacterium]|nr:DUF1778 domain-containing protein [Gammaproteobacteria bacterium]